jgi:hypothetical protein
MRDFQNARAAALRAVMDVARDDFGKVATGSYRMCELVPQHVAALPAELGIEKIGACRAGRHGEQRIHAPSR